MMNEKAMTDATKLENGTCRECGEKLGSGYLCDQCDGDISEL